MLFRSSPVLVEGPRIRVEGEPVFWGRFCSFQEGSARALSARRSVRGAWVDAAKSTQAPFLVPGPQVGPSPGGRAFPGPQVGPYPWKLNAAETVYPNQKEIGGCFIRLVFSHFGLLSDLCPRLQTHCRSCARRRQIGRASCRERV